MNNYTEIARRSDGSFVVVDSGKRRHVPNIEPWNTEWTVINSRFKTNLDNLPKGSVLVLTDSKWVAIEDNRGVKYWLPEDTWNSKPREMKDLGPLPNGYTLIAPSKPLEEVRVEKLSELNNIWKSAEEAGVLQSSLGFPVDANERANRDVSGLISQMKMTGLDKTQFCDANNDFHEVTLDNLKTMQLELIQYAQSLYATKWQLRAAIEAAKTVDELNAIDIKFVTDFTPAPIILAENVSH